ncbi:MAG: RNA polymerase sigma factor [Flavobacteriales bacterium]|nr:RNA polymerase sigma factor [Flavobacteriales bacterium]
MAQKRFGRRKKVKSYLFTTAYHTMIDVIRKDKGSDSFDKANPADYSHNTQYTGLQKVLNEAIDKLPKDQKAVILLRDYEGYDYNEIAEITNLSESQVKVYIFRGRKFLKNYLGSIEQVLG